MRCLPLALSLFLVAAPVIPPALAESTPSSATPSEKGTTNAANLYRQAIEATRAFTPEEDSLLKAFVGQRANHSGAPFAQPHVPALLASFREPLSLIAQATSLPLCDWGHDYSKGMTISHSHFTPLLSLNRLMLLRMRLEISERNYPAALRTVGQIIALRQHCASKAPLLVEQLIQMGLNNQLVATLSCDLSKWPPNFLQTLRQLLSAPTRANFSEILRVEANIATKFFEGTLLKQAEKNTGLDAEKIKAALKAYNEEDLPRIEALLALPPAEALQKAQALEQEIKAKEGTNPISATALPAIIGVIDRILLDDTRFAMLRTAIDIRLHGAEALDKSRDPFSGKPFRLTSEGSGFTLTSEFIEKEAPFSLNFR